MRENYTKMKHRKQMECCKFKSWLNTQVELTLQPKMKVCHMWPNTISSCRICFSALIGFIKIYWFLWIPSSFALTCLAEGKFLHVTEYVLTSLKLWVGIAETDNVQKGQTVFQTYIIVSKKKSIEMILCFQEDMKLWTKCHGVGKYILKPFVF